MHFSPRRSDLRLVFVTRPSALARRQTQLVMQALQQAHPQVQCEEKVILTQGDRIQDRPLPEIGGKGLFTQELERALLAGEADCAVHSLKDLPIESPAGLTIGCVPERGEVRDLLVSRECYTLATLPQGARVGTSSLRRAAQLLAARPDLQVVSLRGNVDTRLRKADEEGYAAIVLAGAGLLRLGVPGSIGVWLTLQEMLPAPGQGALAVQCRAQDVAVQELLAALEHRPTRLAVRAERAFLGALGSGCAVPVAAYAALQPEGGALLSLEGLVSSPDGRQLIRLSDQGDDPEALGRSLAAQALAQGADKILAQFAGNG